MATVRYLVKDVERSIAFYTSHLGFKLEQQSGSAFAMISRDDLTLWLSGPQSSGARPMPDGRRQEPGGWNRGIRFRNEIEMGPGGKQIQIEDPDGNPVEIFEPARRA